MRPLSPSAAASYILSRRRHSAGRVLLRRRRLLSCSAAHGSLSLFLYSLQRRQRRHRRVALTRESEREKRRTDTRRLKLRRSGGRRRTLGAFTHTNALEGNLVSPSPQDRKQLEMRRTSPRLAPSLYKSCLAKSSGRALRITHPLPQSETCRFLPSRKPGEGTIEKTTMWFYSSLHCVSLVFLKRHERIRERMVAIG